MPVTAVELTLQRPAPGPWGLRLQGGLDFDKALVISHVTEGTHSSLSGLMSGDVVLEINGQDAGVMTHKQAQEAIIACGDQVPLLVQRTQDTPPQLSGIKPPDPFRPQVEVVGQLPVTPGPPGDLYTRTSLLAPEVPDDDHWDVRHNVTAKGFTASASDTPGFRSVSAPMTKPGHVPSGPPPLKEYVAYRTEMRGRQGGQAETQGTIVGPGGASSMPQGLAANLSKLANGKQQPPQQQPLAAVQPPTSSGEWAQRLNSDRAGAAGDAEAFTKQFMKQLPGGQPHHGAQPAPMGLKPGPVPAPQAPGDWSKKLVADKAGMATNAEDLTKEFMKQLTGEQ